MSSGSGSEEYDFEYSEDDEGSIDDAEIEIENLYYASKEVARSDIARGVEGFRRVVALGKSPGVWGWKALKKICKLYIDRDHMSTCNNETELLKVYEQLLSFFQKGAVPPSIGEKGLNSILSKVASRTASPGTVGTNEGANVFERLYSLTLRAARLADNERLWVTTSLKLGMLQFQLRNFDRLRMILKELHDTRQRGGGIDTWQGGYVLDLSALQILLYTEEKDNRKLKSLYERSLTVRSSIPHPRTLGIIRECGGKMHMREKCWEDARRDFFEAFKSYEEAGDIARIKCLKYLVLSNMLMESKINPFSCQEAKSYESNVEIQAMTMLVKAYEDNKIFEFERILRQNDAAIMNDPFIKLYINELLRTVRGKVLIKAIKPYHTVLLSYLAQELQIPVVALEDLLRSLIVDGKIDGKIDRVKLALIMTPKVDNEKDASIHHWAKSLLGIKQSLQDNIHPFLISL
jgi:COP9 signalosome complex subunit 2